jgi:serine protease Do
LANDRQKTVEYLLNSTAALVENVGSFVVPNCAGVWISKTLILTANHCVDEHPPNFQYIVPGDLTDKKLREALLLAADKKVDLALLIANPEDLPEHNVVKLSEDPIVVGDPMHVVGHTAGYPWTYSYGFVSAIRDGMFGPSAFDTKVVQISAPVWMGNSGGGAFDSNGQLVGICSWVSKSGPHLTFFIHRDIIKSFLRQESFKKMP